MTGSSVRALVVEVPKRIEREVRHALAFVSPRLEASDGPAEFAFRVVDGGTTIRWCFANRPTFESPATLLCALDASWLDAGSGPTSIVRRLPVSTLDLDAATSAIVCDDVVILDGALAETDGDGAEGLESDDWQGADESTIAARVDLLGSIFWMLTRYEEAVAPERDELDRHRASATVAGRFGLHERALADEWAALLAAALVAASGESWRLVRPVGTPVGIVPTHDIDVPFHWRDLSFGEAMRRTAGGLVKRRDWRAPAIAACWLADRIGLSPRDPFATFDELMFAAESIGATARFYFTADDPRDPVVRARRDPLRGRYDAGDPRLAPVLRSIDARGHVIGLHPCAGAHRDEERLLAQVERLSVALRSAGVTKPVVHARHHYLQWDVVETPRLHAAVGLRFDSTLGWAEAAGFRCGTASPFPLFDLRRRSTLDVVEHSLLAMDVTLLDAPYMALSPGDAVRMVGRLATIASRSGAPAIVLWHNSRLVRGIERATFEAVLRLDDSVRSIGSKRGDPADRTDSGEGVAP